LPTLDSPRVSVIIPARDEAAHIERCVRSVLAQEFEGSLEVLVVDGASTDGTGTIARAAGATVVENPERVIPTGLNRGLAAAGGDVVLRFDAHGAMPKGYVASCLRALEATDGPAIVGGWCEVRAAGPWGRALGEALASRIGIGNARLWRRPSPGSGQREVDTVHFGCFRREVVEALGGWREDMLANEDFELGYRVRASGGKVVFDPAIWSVYHPRESLSAIARQFLNYGRWKAEVVAVAPRSLRARQLAPPALLATCVVAAAPSPLALPARTALAAYAATIAGRAARSEAGWRLGVVLATMHVTWGVGLLGGLPAAAARRVRRSSSQPPRQANEGSGEHRRTP
jgi:succinoglycan biosynthesis protein ExoA